MADVFISYARTDEASARELARLLTEAGLTVWFDGELVPGQNWARSIREEIDQSKLVIALMSPAAMESNWVQAEALHAFASSKLLPVLVPGMTADLLPLPINQLHAVRIDDKSLLETVRRAFLRTPSGARGDKAAGDKAASIEAAIARGGVALRAGPAEVRDVGQSSMLAGANMIDFVRQARLRLGHAAILATIPGAASNDSASRSRHGRSLKLSPLTMTTAPLPGSDRSAGRRADSDRGRGGRRA